MITSRSYGETCVLRLFREIYLFARWFYRLLGDSFCFQDTHKICFVGAAGVSPHQQSICNTVVLNQIMGGDFEKPSPYIVGGVTAVFHVTNKIGHIKREEILSLKLPGPGQNVHRECTYLSVG